MAMTGFKLFNNTKMGKALREILPKQTTRVIIDIPANDSVKLYYQTVDSTAILGIDWGVEILPKIEIIDADKNKQNKEMWNEYNWLNEYKKYVDAEISKGLVPMRFQVWQKTVLELATELDEAVKVGE